MSRNHRIIGAMTVACYRGTTIMPAVTGNNVPAATNNCLAVTACRKNQMNKSIKLKSEEVEIIQCRTNNNP